MLSPRKKHYLKKSSLWVSRIFYFLIVQYFCFWMLNCIPHNLLRDSTQSLIFSEEVADGKGSSLWSEIFVLFVWNSTRSQHNSLDTDSHSLKCYLETFSLYGFHIWFCKRINQQHHKVDSRGNDHPNNQKEKHWKL